MKTILRLTSLRGKEHLPRPYMGYMLEKLAHLLAAMTVVECGIRYEEVDMEAIWEGYDLAFPGKRMPRAGNVRSTEPLIFQPVPVPEPLDKSFHHWDEYWDWSPEVH